MKLYFLSILLVTLKTSKSTSNIPSQPNQWTAEFTEIHNGANLKGRWIYDWTNRQLRIDKESGHNEKFCKNFGVSSDNGPCTQIVKNGKRYIIHPKRKTCCICCFKENGCGINSPDFLSRESTLERNLSGEGKPKTFFLSNFGLKRYTINSNGIPLKIRSDFSEIKFENFRTKLDGDADFELPDFANCENNCPSFSVCGKYRKRNNSFK